MALLNRLFPSRKKSQRNQRGYVPYSCKELKWEPFEFTEDQVRVLLYRECERRGRKLLFDSRSVKKIPLQSTSQQCSRTKSGSIPKANEKKKLDPPFVEVTNGFGYQYFAKPGADMKMLGEMVFGSVAMTVRGSTLKVHLGGTSAETDSSPIIMLTKVALSPLRGRKTHLSETLAEDSCGSSINSMSELVSSGGSSSDSKLYHSNSTRPLDVPLLSASVSRTQFFLGTDTDLTSKRLFNSFGIDDSGCYGDAALHQRKNGGDNQGLPVTITVNNARKVSGGSLSSVRRRWLRSNGGCLESNSSQNLSQFDSVASCGSLNGSFEENTAKRSKLGTAIVIDLTSEQSRVQLEFLLEHAAVLESTLVRLHTAMEQAYLKKDLFVSLMMKATNEVQQSVVDLLRGPRLADPVWLSLMSVGSQDSPPSSARASIATGFMHDLCHLLDNYDIKDTNFFISTLITAVLTHHLGWVSTVIPECNNSHSSFKTSHALSEISKSHPYNPLWAQMMDLFGAVGNPLKTSRTIVVSEASKSRAENIERLLRVLSYFIRCAGIENFESSKDANETASLSNLSCSTYENGSEAGGSGATLLTLVPSASDLTDTTNGPLTSNYPDREQTVANFCEVTIAQENPCNDKVKNSENLLHRTKSEKLIIEHYPREKYSSPQKSLLSYVRGKGESTKASGMRRTVSYSSKMVSRTEEEPERAIEAVNIPHLSRSSTRRQLQVDPENSTDFEKQPSNGVIFVLGENENLVGLKSSVKDRTDDECMSISDTRTTQLTEREQALSEVESGFSECDSLELSPLSPVRNTRQARGKLYQQVAGAPKCLCNEWCGNIPLLTVTGEVTRTCLLDVTNDQSMLPRLKKSDCDSVSVHSSSMIQLERERASSDHSPSRKNRLLARSLSVNLPVCQRLVKDSAQSSVRMCSKCGGSTVFPSGTENICQGATHAENELKRTSSRKNVGRKLQKARSLLSFNAKSAPHSKSNPEDLSSLCTKSKSTDEISPEDSAEQDCAKNETVSLKEGEAASTDKSFVCVPFLGSVCGESRVPRWEPGVAATLFSGVADHYIADRTLQGIVMPPSGWPLALKRDLSLEVAHPILDPEISEAVAIIGSLDSWQVHLLSSNISHRELSPSGARVTLSRLVANMLEALRHLWLLGASPDLCVSVLEERLAQLCSKSYALVDLLLSTELCDMDTVTSALSIDANDVPLLLAVASTYSPEVTRRYGISFR